MDLNEYRRCAAECTRFLCDHSPFSVADRLRQMADSPYAAHRPDGYGKGGYLAEFEAELAGLFTKDVAVVAPSGTMVQQIALRIWSDRQGSKQVAFHPKCHLHTHEHMAYQELHGLHAELLGSADRLFNIEDLKAIKEPISSLLIELPQRDIGGALPTWAELTEICDYARTRNIRLHLDGARLWECGPYYGKPPAEIAAQFDSVYVSFYKILGGLPGAALLGPSDFIADARIWLRRHGGNLQTQFPTAISAKIGMDERLGKIPMYVEYAGRLAKGLRSLGLTVIPEAPPTNMFHLQFSQPVDGLLDGLARVAREDKVFLLHHISEEGISEVYFGDSSLDLPVEEVVGLFKKALVAVAAG